MSVGHGLAHGQSMLKTLITMLVFAMAALPAWAQSDSLRDYFVQELVDDGYPEITVTRTLLRRLRFVGESELSRREIIVNPVTGVVLRDFIKFFRGDDDDDHDREHTEHEDDDDDDDDDDEDDNSGSGSSGSGSSGSGSDDDDQEDN